MFVSVRILYHAIRKKSIGHDKIIEFMFGSNRRNNLSIFQYRPFLCKRPLHTSKTKAAA